MKRADFRVVSVFTIIVAMLIVGQFAMYRLGYGSIAGAPMRGGSTTLAQIVAGEYGSAYDKQGGGGTIVTVNNVVFHYPKEEVYDGDWHIGASDPTYHEGNFIVEVNPRDQAAMGRPPLGVRLQIQGVPYCDLFHGQEQGDGGEGWHTDGSCWEIHPLLHWQRMPTLSVGVGPNVK